MKCLSERAVEVLPKGYCRGWLVVSLSAFVPLFRIRAGKLVKKQLAIPPSSYLLKSHFLSFVVFKLYLFRIWAWFCSACFLRLACTPKRSILGMWPRWMWRRHIMCRLIADGFGWWRCQIHLQHSSFDKR